jgi:hypothetical protein
MKVLYLCATNMSARLNPFKLQSYINDIYPDEDKFENYFIGIDLNMNGKYYCNADLKKDFAKLCNYTDNYFDLVVSEFCPLALFDTNLLYYINKILKQDGILLIPQYNQLYISGKEYKDVKLQNKFNKLGYKYISQVKGVYGDFIMFKKYKISPPQQLRKSYIKKITKIPKQVLYLCSVDQTAINNAMQYNQLLKYGLKWNDENIENYFVGDELNNFGCKASVVDEDFVEKCGLTFKFDAIISDFCPVYGKNGILNTGKLLYYMDEILKTGGYFIIQNIVIKDFNILSDKVNIYGKLYNNDELIDKMQELGYNYVSNFIDIDDNYKINYNIFIKL